MLRSPLARVPRAATVALRCALPMAACTMGAAQAQAADARELVQTFVAPFVYQQAGNGAYATGPRVQGHLKAEMSVCQAARVLADSTLAASARRDLDWVLRERLEPSGGLNWDGPENPFFFEVHQHWFLIASQWVREVNHLGDEYRLEQAATWEFLRRSNPAERDFYLANEQDHGVFFAYRSVDRQGHFQTQAAFKGSYEIGAAVWALSLASHAAGTDTLAVLRSYQNRMIERVARPPDQGGFYDPLTGGWVRALNFSPHGWSGFVARDRKYSLHMLEGCLESEFLETNPVLHPLVRRDLADLLLDVRQDGTIDDMPDGFGSPEYEYGLALSVLALGVELFRWEDPAFALELGTAARAVLDFAARSFAPRSDEDHAVLLLGIGRVARSVTAPGTPADNGEASPTIADLAVRAWPNPTRAGLTLEWSAPPAAQANLLVLDASGRVCARLDIPPSFGRFHRLRWDGHDGSGRLLPIGSYQLSLRTASREGSARVVLLR